MKSKHKRDFQVFGSIQTHRNTLSDTHPAAAHVDRADTVPVTHTHTASAANWQAFPALPVQDHPQVMFMNWEE